VLRNWVVHTYFTQGYYDKGLQFITSFRKFHDTPILASTRSLSADERWELLRIPRVIVSDHHLNVHDMTHQTGKNLAVLHDYEKSVINREPPGDNLLWKLYISVKDRYRRSIEEVLNLGHNVLHFDADTVVKRSLDPLFKMAYRHDICIKFKNYQCSQGQVLGSLISFQNNLAVAKFTRTWFDIIDSVKVHEMPRGFGQKSFYSAYLKTRDSVNFGRIPDSFIKRGRRPPRHKGKLPKSNFSGWKSDYIDKIK